MSEYYHLDIYKEAYKLLNEILYTVKNIRKDFKRTLGEDLRHIARDNINLIKKANATKIKSRRLEFLEQLKDNLDILIIDIRSGRDTGIIPRKTFSRIIEPLLVTQEQARKWYNYTDKQIKKEKVCL
jgi:hypothetical protein